MVAAPTVSVIPRHPVPDLVPEAEDQRRQQQLPGEHGPDQGDVEDEPGIGDADTVSSVDIARRMAPVQRRGPAAPERHQPAKCPPAGQEERGEDNPRSPDNPDAPQAGRCGREHLYGDRGRQDEAGNHTRDHQTPVLCDRSVRRMGPGQSGLCWSVSFRTSAFSSDRLADRRLGAAGRHVEIERARKAEQRLLQHRRIEPVGDGLSGLLRADEPGLAQHREVGGHGRLGDVELIAQVARAHRPLAQELEHPATGWIGQGLE